jgi:hypothetical protein
MAGSDSGYERLGAKLLSLPDVIAQSNGAVIPVDGAATAVDIGTVAFAPRVHVMLEGDSSRPPGSAPA